MLQIARILCPVDFSEFARRALHHAAAVAAWYGSRLDVLHVVPNRPAMDVPPDTLADADRERILTELRRFAADVPAEVAVELSVTEAPDVHVEILAQAAARHADLLVLGSHGRSGFERLVLGSVTERVMRKAHCPTMVVPRGAMDAGANEPVHLRRIVCPVDFSKGSTQALDYALALAEETDAQLTLLHVIEIPPELDENPLSSEFNVEAVRAAAEAKTLAGLRALVPEEARTYCTVKTEVREGAPYREILRASAAQDADLIVMGVQGRRAIDLMVFGSNTARVARAAVCPILIVPSR